MEGEKSMEIGNKILELRKKENLSQEELAEKVGVARQTISKWELGETAPDIKQSKQLADIFNVSVDELVDGNNESAVMKKLSNTEKLAGIVIKMLKTFGIILAVFVVIDIIAFVIFFGFMDGKNKLEKSDDKQSELSYVYDNNYSLSNTNYQIEI